MINFSVITSPSRRRTLIEAASLSKSAGDKRQRTKYAKIKQFLKIQTKTAEQNKSQETLIRYASKITSKFYILFHEN